MRKWILFFVLMALVVPGIGRVTTDPLMPADGAVEGWTRFEPPRQFTRSDLYGYVDGGAEIFLEFGFEQLQLQKYRKGDDEFAVELYRMADPEAALGIYLMKCGQEHRDPALGVRHTVGRYQLMLQKGRYFVIVQSQGGLKALVPDLVAFGRVLAGHIPAGKPIEALKLLPRKGLVPGSERLVRGPYGLQALYTLGDGDILSLGGKVTAVAAEYTGGQKETTTLILVPYPNEAAAEKAFRHLVDNLDSYLEVVAKDARRLVFKDYAGRYGEVSRQGRRLTVRVNLETAPVR